MSLSTHPLAALPGWLFCPADRPERYSKAAARADVVILDLEDAVNPADKPAARRALLAQPLDPERTVVRVNDAASEHHAADLEALAMTGYSYAMLPKVESPADLEGLAGYHVVVIIESAAGALAAPAIAAQENVIGVMWGGEDLTADLGGRSSRGPGGGYREVVRHVRATSLLAAKAHGKFALDAVHIDIPDLDGQRAEAEDAAASGFDATVAIHPSQIPVIREAHRPSEASIAWARGVLAAAQGAHGAFAYEGQMIDAPLLKQAALIDARGR